MAGLYAHREEVIIVGAGDQRRDVPRAYGCRCGNAVILLKGIVRTVHDAGVVVIDAGVVVIDAGVVVIDAGVVVIDAGVVIVLLVKVYKTALEAESEDEDQGCR